MIRDFSNGGGCSGGRKSAAIGGSIVPTWHHKCTISVVNMRWNEFLEVKGLGNVRQLQVCQTGAFGIEVAEHFDSR